MNVDGAREHGQNSILTTREYSRSPFEAWRRACVGSRQDWGRLIMH
jgi:hypothetical protein